MKSVKKIISLILIVAVVYSCELIGNKTPEQPPLESMVINFNEFNVVKSAEMQNSTKLNWFYSAATVVTWSGLMTTNLAIPVAAFKSTIGKEPTRIDDNTWEWTYAVDGFSGQYTAKLKAIKDSRKVNWEMYLTKTGTNAFTDFLWFKGTSDLDNSDGQWIIYNSPAHPVEILQIDWKEKGKEMGSVKYTYLRTKNESNSIDSFFGSYLEYGLQSGSLDAYMKIHAYIAAKDGYTDTEIQWSRDKYNGRVKSDFFFKDANWHCWDAQGNDVTCN